MGKKRREFSSEKRKEKGERKGRKEVPLDHAS